jgi:hypothetical protein
MAANPCVEGWRAGDEDYAKLVFDRYRKLVSPSDLLLSPSWRWVIESGAG